MDLSKFGYNEWKQGEVARLLSLEGIKRVTIDDTQIYIKFENESDVTIPVDETKAFYIDVARLEGIEALKAGRAFLDSLIRAIGRLA